MGIPTSRVSRVVMTGPLAPFADTYRLELRERGYTQRTTVNQLRQVARLSRWLEAYGLEAYGLTVAELSVERLEEFLAFQRTSGRSRSQWSRPGLLCLLDVLRTAGVSSAEAPAVPASSTEALLVSFEHTSAPSVAWVLQRPGGTWGTPAGSSRGCRRSASSPSSQRARSAEGRCTTRWSARWRPSSGSCSPPTTAERSTPTECWASRWSSSPPVRNPN